VRAGRAPAAPSTAVPTAPSTAAPTLSELATAALTDAALADALGTVMGAATCATPTAA